MNRRRGIVVNFDTLSGLRMLGQLGVMLRVRHTDRTWGIDIESLLSGHVESLLRVEGLRARVAQRHSRRISFFVGSFFFLGAIGGAFGASSRFVRGQTENLQNVRTVNQDSTEYLQSQIDFLMDILVSGVWTRFTFVTLGFLVLALIVSMLLAGWVESSASKRPYSFVTLSKKAEKHRAKFLEQQQRDWVMFCVSIFTSVVTGIVANLLFVHFFTGVG